MKINVLITLLSCLSLLTSCGGGGNSQAQLKITRAFAMANTAFPGGLVVTGKRLNSNEHFSLSLDGSSEVNLKLTRGTWFFTAVGWNGGSPTTPKNFGGDPLCGWTQKDLSNYEEVIDLVITKEKCTNSVADGTGGIDIFAGGAANVDAAAASFKKLAFVIACNSFYKSHPLPSDSPATLDVSSGYTTAYCNSLAEDLQGDVKSFRILSVNKLPGQVVPRAGLSSGCFDMTNDTVSGLGDAGQPFAGEIGPRLPFKNVPFIIQTFKDADCPSSELVTNLYFLKGLKDGNPSELDHHLSSISPTKVRLLIPGNDLKRGRSPFIALLPYIKKLNAGSPAKFETMPSSGIYHDFRATRGVNNKFLISEEKDCISFSYSAVIDSGSCLDLGDKVEVTVQASGTGDGSGSFTLNGKTYNVYFFFNSVAHQRYSSQKIIADLLGKSNDDTPDTFFWPIDDEMARDYGVLSEAREMLAASGAGGVIGISGSPASFTDACMNIPDSSKEVSIFDFEKMSLNKYKVTVHGSPVSSPGSFFCNIDDPSEGACSETFDKRLLIYDYSFSSLTPTIVMEISCDKMIGRLEKLGTNSEGGLRTDENEMITWNTEKGSSLDLSLQRFEHFYLSKHYTWNGSWNYAGEERKMARLRKKGPDDYEIWDYAFNTFWNDDLNKWQQSIDSHQLQSASSTNICYKYMGEANDYSTSDYLLLNSSFLPSGPSTGLGTNEFTTTNAWNIGQVACARNFTSIVVEDVSPSDGIDDNGADKMNGSLNFKLGSLQDASFPGIFGGPFFTP